MPRTWASVWRPSPVSATREQKQRYVPSLASGQGIAAWALTEPGSGSDAAAMATTATRRNGSWVLNGSKQFITNAEVAETLVIFANQDRSIGYRGVCAFIVPAGTKGMQINPQHNKMGIRASSTCEIVFEDAEVPAENIIGEEGMGFRYAMDILDSSRISIAAQCVGIGQAALEEAVRYAQLRETFGRPLARHQAIQFKAGRHRHWGALRPRRHHARRDAARRRSAVHQ